MLLESKCSKQCDSFDQSNFDSTQSDHKFQFFWIWNIWSLWWNKYIAWNFQTSNSMSMHFNVYKNVKNLWPSPVYVSPQYMLHHMCFSTWNNSKSLNMLILMKLDYICHLKIALVKTDWFNYHQIINNLLLIIV